MSKIVLTHNKKQYELEYNRQSVKMMEGQGFSLEEITSKPMTMIPLLFQGAFLKNCKGIKRALIDEIFEGISDKTSLMEALVEMYADTISTLTDDNSGGNVSWELVK
jgi:hypothetical protein